MSRFEARALDQRFANRRFARAAAAQPAEVHRTVRLSLIGRFMRESKAEYPAQLTRVSVGHLEVSTSVRCEPGERIIAYFDHIGGLEGTVTDCLDGGFRMRLNITTRKREKFAAQLTWLLNKSEFTGLEERRHQRFAVGNKAVALRIGDEAFECTLLDISLSGASIETPRRPPIGSEVQVGRQTAIVRRHHERGIGVQFLTVQDADVMQGYLR